MMAIGMFAMTIESQFFFFTGMAFIIIGNGFFKPNISSMVGKLYEPGDSRRDGGFTIFYMGINLGAFFSPLTCGLVGELFGWHYGFGLAGIGMIAGLINFSLSKRILLTITELLQILHCLPRVSFWALVGKCLFT